MGPDALRVAGVVEALARFVADVVDRGNLSGPLTPLSPLSPVQRGYRHLPEVIAWNRLVYAAVSAELAAGRLPILLGGDHALGIGRSARWRHCRQSRRKLRVLWLDAHADFNTAALHADGQPARHAGGVPVRLRPGGPRTSAASAGSAARRHSAGGCSVDEAEKHFLREAGIGSTTCAASTRSACATRRSPASMAKRIYVSLDMDFLVRRSRASARLCAAGRPIASAAVHGADRNTGRLGRSMWEPAFDHRNTTAELAVDLIEPVRQSTLIRAR